MTNWKRGLDAIGLGLATARLRGARSDHAKERAAAGLADRLGQMHGIPQKVGQLLSMTTSGGAFSGNRSNGQAIPYVEALSCLTAAWGRPALEVCRTIDPLAFAASIGQVHRALLREGDDVAVKLRLPGIEASLASDLSALDHLLRPLGRVRSDFDADGFSAALKVAIVGELDYASEARHQMAFAAAVEGLPVVVPEVVESLSNKDVLVTRWEDGDDIDAVADWTDGDRHALAEAMLDVFLTLLFVDGLVHSDPHPGNYRFRATHSGVQVVLYDFGSTVQIDQAAQRALLRLIRPPSVESSDQDVFDAFLALGFDADLLRTLRGKLRPLCDLLFEPFRSDGSFRMDGWNRSERAAEILGDDRVAFRMSAPPSLLQFMRAWQGLLFYLRTIGSPVDWSAALERALARRGGDLSRSTSPSRVQAPASPQQVDSPFAEGKSLCIRVRDGQRTKALVTLPARAIVHIEDFIEPAIAKRIGERGLSLAQIRERVVASRFAPQEVLSMKDGARQVDVWICESKG